MKLNRKFLILGHPRSGTMYMSALFRANGYDIQHEQMGEHGTSNWQMAVHAKEYPYPLNCGDKIVRGDVEFETIIHVLRAPLLVIASTYHTEAIRSDGFRSQYVNMCGNPWEKAVMSYVGWTKLIQAQHVDLTMALPRAKELLGFSNDFTNTSCNSRPHPPITKEQLYKEVSVSVFLLYDELQKFYNSLL